VRFYDGVANVIEPQEHTGDLKEPWALARETKSRSVKHDRLIASVG
jgi:hypothetical protein